MKGKPLKLAAEETRSGAPLANLRTIRKAPRLSSRRWKMSSESGATFRPLSHCQFCSIDG